MHQIGFMQGRLSPKPEGRIQAFPKSSWREEFSVGRELEFDCIELIYDDLYLDENPLSTPSGRHELKILSLETGLKIDSICADFFMVHRLTDHSLLSRQKNQDHALKLLFVAAEIGCPLVEFPFVDSSSIGSLEDQRILVPILQNLSETAETLGVLIALETDLAPVQFRGFLDHFSVNVGANFDIGNSAALGYDSTAECRAFGSRIFNVHIKDRVLGGTTVPLTFGHADFRRAFSSLNSSNYRRNFILQTAPDPDYLGAAKRYQQMVREWIRAAWISS